MTIRYTSPTDLVVTELLKQTPAWAKARGIGIDAIATGRKMSDMVADIVAALESEIDILDMIDSVMPGDVPGDQIGALKDYYSHLAAASVIADIEGKTLPVVPMMTGGIQVLRHREIVADDGGDVTLAYPVIVATVTPFTPLSIAEEFRETILRTYPTPIRESQNPDRDREWLAQNMFGGKSYRWIALNDARAGLEPHERLSPEEYPGQVEAARQVVAKAVQHYKKEWKRILDSLSTLDA